MVLTGCWALSCCIANMRQRQENENVGKVECGNHDLLCHDHWSSLVSSSQQPRSHPENINFSLFENFYNFTTFSPILSSFKVSIEVSFKILQKETFEPPSKVVETWLNFNQILWMAHCVIWLKNNFSRIITFVLSS